jgi:uncharacterized protein (TIGR03118 family)
MVEVVEGRCLPSGYLQTNLVSDVPGLAQFTDAQLVNPWGLAAFPGGPFWISDNQPGLSTLYDSAGRALTVPVSVPGSGGVFTGAAGAPTAAVFNDAWAFPISENGNTEPGLFLFASEDGTISGWNGLVDPTHAVLAVDNSGRGADYRGLAIGENGSDRFLFAANFHAGTIDVFDASFNAVGSFTDPNLPTGYAPFNVQNIGGQLFVTYALRNAAGTDETYGAGLGFIDVFNTSGRFLERFASQGSLNAPWGLALAPANFGTFSNDLLVGNVGDGHINAFDPRTGAWLRSLQDAQGNAVVLPSVWGLMFGAGGTAGEPDTLFFTAGLDNEQHGLFGSIQPVESKDVDAVRTTLDPSVSDNYPLPPPLAPTFHGSGEAQAPELPVLVPLRVLPAAATPAPTPAGVTGAPLVFEASMVFTIAPVRGIAGMPASGFATSGFAVSGGTLVVHEGLGQQRESTQALDLLLTHSTQMDSSEQVVTLTAFRAETEVGVVLTSATEESGETPVPQVEVPSGAMVRGAASPGTTATTVEVGWAGKPDVVTEAGRRTAVYHRSLSFWLFFSVSVGIYLTRFYAQPSRNAVEPRRPHCISS